LNCELCESVPVGIVLKWKCCRGVWLLCHGHMEPSQFPCVASASVSLSDSTLQVDLFINQHFSLLLLTKILIMGLIILNVAWKFLLASYELGLPSSQIPKLKGISSIQNSNYTGFITRIIKNADSKPGIRLYTNSLQIHKLHNCTHTLTTTSHHPHEREYVPIQLGILFLKKKLLQLSEASILDTFHCTQCLQMERCDWWSLAKDET
jgi:hypothetical protein